MLTPKMLAKAREHSRTYGERDSCFGSYVPASLKHVPTATLPNSQSLESRCDEQNLTLKMVKDVKTGELRYEVKPDYQS